MKKLFGLLLLFLPCLGPSEVYRVEDLSGGINDSVPGNKIADNEAVSIVNFHVDPVSRGLIQRRGSSKQNTMQLSGSVAVDVFSHVQSDGDSFLISVASRTISYSTSNGAIWTSIFTTATLSSVWDGVPFADDNFYMVNQNDGGYGFTGSAFTSAGSMPYGKFIEAYQNRLFVANTASTPYRVFFSGLLQPSTWTTSTDYFDMPESVTCIGEPFDGGLPIYTKNTTWMLRGTGPNDFYLQQISGQIGCAENRDVQNFDIGENEYQVFLSLGPNGSRKSIYALLGNRLVDIGRKVSGLMDGVSVFDSSARTHEWDTEDDFNLGTTSHTTVFSIDEAVHLSTWSRTDTEGSDFGAGTLNSVSTQIVSGLLNLAVNNGNVANYDFSADSPPPGAGDPVTGWTRGGTGTISFLSGECGTNSAYMQSVGGVMNTFKLRFVDGSGTVLVDFGNDYGSLASGCQTVSKDISSYAGTVAKIQFYAESNINTFSLTTSSFVYISTGPLSYSAKILGDDPIFSSITGGNSTISSGTFTSQAFQVTAFSTWNWIATSAPGASNGNTISFQTQSSSDGVSWDSAVNWSTGSAPTSLAKNYVRYIVNFSSTSSSTSLPYVSSVELAARATSGTYTSDVRDGSAEIASWEVFNPQVGPAGTHAFYYRTNPSFTGISTTAWTSISPGGDVSGSDRYFQWKDVMTTTGSAVDPYVSFVAQNFFTGTGAQPGDMEVWNNDLWMTYTSTAGTYNDSIIVINEEGRFSKFSGLNVYGFAAHNRRLLSGTSINDGINGGYVQQLDAGSTDDGSAISASVVLKHQEFKPYEDYEKNMDLVYFSYSVDQGTFTATVSENFNDVETDYEVDFSAHNTIARWKLEAEPGTVGRQFGLTFSNSYPGSRLSLYPPITYHISQSQLIPQP